MMVKVTGSVQRRAAIYAALGEPVRLAVVDHLRAGDASPGELTARFGIGTNLLAHHLGVLSDAGLVRRVRSEGDRRRQYVQLRLEDPAVAALTAALPPEHDDVVVGRRAGSAIPGTADRVVFVCTANAARSQLAAAAWRQVSTVPAASGGTHPAARVHPRAVRVARRHGLDLDTAVPARLDDVAHDGDLLVAVCDNAHEELTNPGHPDPDRPACRQGRRLHWSVPDPVRVDTDEAFEAAYDQITRRVHRLARHLEHEHTHPAGAPAPVTAGRPS